MYGHPHRITVLVVCLPIQTTGERNGRSVADVLLQPIHRIHLPKKIGNAGTNGSDVRGRIVPAISQAGKIDATTIAKRMTRNATGTADGTVLRFRHSDNGRRARVLSRPRRALWKNLMTSGSKNLALVYSWAPLPSRQRLPQRLRALRRRRLPLSLRMMIRTLTSDHNLHLFWK